MLNRALKLLDSNGASFKVHTFIPNEFSLEQSNNKVLSNKFLD